MRKVIIYISFTKAVLWRFSEGRHGAGPNPNCSRWSGRVEEIRGRAADCASVLTWTEDVPDTWQHSGKEAGEKRVCSHLLLNIKYSPAVALKGDFFNGMLEENVEWLILTSLLKLFNMWQMWFYPCMLWSIKFCYWKLFFTYCYECIELKFVVRCSLIFTSKNKRQSNSEGVHEIHVLFFHWRWCRSLWENCETILFYLFILH